MDMDNIHMIASKFSPLSPPHLAIHVADLQLNVSSSSTCNYYTYVDRHKLSPFLYMYILGDEIILHTLGKTMHSCT